MTDYYRVMRLWCPRVGEYGRPARHSRARSSRQPVELGLGARAIGHAQCGLHTRDPTSTAAVPPGLSTMQLATGA